jgi:serine/threonine-protein kinase
MAVVYAATHRNGYRVAIKMLKPRHSSYADLRRAFGREARVANEVPHRCVVPVLDDDITENGEPFLVLPLLEGETLESRWAANGGRLPARFVIAVAHELLSALEVAHAKGILHRDLKPDNVFLTSEGQVRLMDFGIARNRDYAVADTMPGRVVGTPAYMPPERALGQRDKIDGRSDIWAIGAMMFRLLSGQFVHDERSPQSLLNRHGTAAAPPLRAVAPSVAPPLAEVVDRALAFEVDARWRDAGEMKVALERAARLMFSDALELERWAPVPQRAASTTQSNATPTERLAAGEVDRAALTGTMAPSTPAPAVPTDLRDLGG